MTQNGLLVAEPPPMLFPDSDGEPMAQNSLQLVWITTFYGNLCILFHHDANVFVGSDMFWYPIRDDRIRVAPDAFVVFGRPKGHRGSYKQFEEDDVPMTVVFEVLSPGNTFEEMAAKLDFYELHQVEEYYLFDPDRNKLIVYRRVRDTLVGQTLVDEWISPRLKIRFVMCEGELRIFFPNGRPFLTFEELELERAETADQLEITESKLNQTESKLNQTESKLNQAESKLAQVQSAQKRMAELMQRMFLQQASAEDLAELQRLIQDNLGTSS